MVPGTTNPRENVFCCGEGRTPHICGLLCKTMRTLFEEDLLRRWYPLVLDRECGGYFTNVTHDWKLPPEQEKMIVTQARHIWTTAKTAKFVQDGSRYEAYARHGLQFLRNFMWDQQYGGFFQIRSRQGGYSGCNGWREEKRTYGNAFAIFALAALYRLTNDPEVLEFAQEAFRWVEDHAHDSTYEGYFQFLTRQGEPFDRDSVYTSVASDRNELGYKDQNSSIHLLEAYTELYHVWQDPTLRKRLSSLLLLIRDTMVDDKGHLRLFFTRDWTPVSFRDASEETRAQNYGLDHVSFGHDYETAFLMLEASYALGIENDARTLSIARRMLEHAIMNGWDQHSGGFFDGGVYLQGSDQCAIVRPTKTWWGQAEALNALLIFSRIFPQDTGYWDLFEKEWDYTDRYILDHQNGDWFEGGLDQEPQFITGPKSHIWKCTYHTGRALMNCIALLSEDDHNDTGIAERKSAIEKMIAHWRRT
jgi:mannobiose 2-epimerase